MCDILNHISNPIILKIKSSFGRSCKVCDNINRQLDSVEPLNVSGNKLQDKLAIFSNDALAIVKVTISAQTHHYRLYMRCFLWNMA